MILARRTSAAGKLRELASDCNCKRSSSDSCSDRLVCALAIAHSSDEYKIAIRALCTRKVTFVTQRARLHLRQSRIRHKVRIDSRAIEGSKPRISPKPRQGRCANVARYDG